MKYPVYTSASRAMIDGDDEPSSFQQFLREAPGQGLLADDAELQLVQHVLQQGTANLDSRQQQQLEAICDRVPSHCEYSGQPLPWDERSDSNGFGSYYANRPDRD